MRNTILILAMMIWMNSFGQVTDLAKLAIGSLKENIVVYDTNKNVFGYLLIYEKSKDKTTSSIEYIFLDKNLNKIINSEYSEPIYKSKNPLINEFLTVSYKDCILSENTLLLVRKYTFTSLSSYLSEEKLIANTYQKIYLNENKISDEYSYNDNCFTIFCNKTDSILKRSNAKTANNSNSALSSDKLIPVSNNGKSAFIKITNSHIELIDWENKSLMHFNIEQPDDQSLAATYSLAGISDNRLYIEKVINKKNNLDNIKVNFITGSFKIPDNQKAKSLIAIDLNTGNKLWENELENETFNPDHRFEIKYKNGLTYIIGNYISPEMRNKPIQYSTSGSKKISGNASFEDLYLSYSAGFFLKIIDNSGNVKLDKHLPWTEMQQFYPMGMDKNGLVDKKFKLISKEFFVFDGDKISILTEKRNSKTNTETAGMSVLNFDNSFNPVSYNELESGSTQKNFSKYLFSQKDDTNNSVSFFNLITTPKSNDLELGLNTVTNGVLHSDKITIYRKKDIEIFPFIAKSGYILLNEINEKEHTNDIRLEKLNL